MSLFAAFVKQWKPKKGCAARANDHQTLGSFVNVAGIKCKKMMCFALVCKLNPH
jgi:hypothetical protein